MVCSSIKGASWAQKVKLLTEIMELVRPEKSTKRKGRTGYTDNEKEIFMNIMKTSEGGKFWKVIVESKGGTTNSSRHDVWVQVAKIFNESTGKNLDSSQIKALWGRIKIERKKKHDNKKYKEACAKTGSGVGPGMPPPADGDDLDFGLNDMDPTLCGFNKLVRPGALMTAAPSSPKTPSTTSTGPAFLFPGNPHPVRFPTPTLRSPVTPPSQEISSASHGITPLGREESDAMQIFRSGPLDRHPMPSPSFNPSQVLIMNLDNGEQITAETVVETPKGRKK